MYTLPPAGQGQWGITESKVDCRSYGCFLVLLLYHMVCLIYFTTQKGASGPDGWTGVRMDYIFSVYSV